MSQQREDLERAVLKAAAEAEDRGESIERLEDLTALVGGEKDRVARIVRLLIEDGLMTGIDATTFGGPDWLELRPTRRGLREAAQWDDLAMLHRDPVTHNPRDYSELDTPGPIERSPGLPTAVWGESRWGEATWGGDRSETATETEATPEAKASEAELKREEPQAAAEGATAAETARRAEDLLTPADREFISEQSARLAAGDPKAFVIVTQDVIKRMRRVEDLSPDPYVRLHAGAAAASLQIVLAAERDEFPAQQSEPASVALRLLLARLAGLGMVAAKPELALVVAGCNIVLDYWVKHRQKSGQ